MAGEPHDPGDVERRLRDGVPAAIGALVRRGTSFADAEDAVQDAAAIALGVWPERGARTDRSAGWCGSPSDG